MIWQRGHFPGDEPPKHPRGRPRGTRVQHLRRAPVSPRAPHHVTVRVRRGVWNLRSQRCFNRIAQALSGVKKREFFRITHFSVQGNHVHLIVEAADRAALSNGMRALLIRIARSLNALMGTHGRLYEDRYHETVVTSRSQLRVVVRYVLENHAKHMARIGKAAPLVDIFSSAVRSDLVRAGGTPAMREACS